MDGLKLKHEVLTELRERPVAQVQSGESLEVVVRAIGFSRAYIYNWLAMYRAGGWDALDARKRGGPPRKLNRRIGYSPELNPGESVWREVKSHRLGRAGVFTFADMKSNALGALCHLAHRPDQIPSLFRTPSTLYAA
jgi:hypothetical protein